MRYETECYLFSFVGVPYRWGGNSPILGFDCSGFAQEILQSAGLYHGPDTNAQGLYEHFKYAETTKDLRDMGDLLFFGKDKASITHVAIAVNDIFMIEAGGGNSTTTTEVKADSQNAFVRMRPISNRKDLVAICKVEYP